MSQRPILLPLVRPLLLIGSSLMLAALVAHPALADSVAKPGGADAVAHDAKRHRLDRSGSRRVGVASVYAHRFAGRRMADGERMDPHDDNAASRTLPLGTKARVTNLENGRSARVTIQDRGPYVKGRIVDLSPTTARRIGLTPEQGITKVAVTPITVPQPDDGVESGDAAPSAN